MKTEGVIFDWAGTIVDFGSLAPMGAFVKLFERHGVPVSIEQARIPMGLPKLEHIRVLGRMDGIAQAWRQSHAGKELTDADSLALLEEFEPMSAASAFERRAFVPGFMHTYQWLSEHAIRVATTTGYTRRIMSPLIEFAASQGFSPDLVICCDDVQVSRPDPMGVVACCKAMKLAPGSTVLKVDDTAPGIAEGLNAGCTTVGVAASGNALGWALERWNSADDVEKKTALKKAKQSLLDAGAHFVIESVAQLPQLIQELSLNTTHTKVGS
jgi:phosphonoacetaldehyde hydrolase